MSKRNKKSKKNRNIIIGLTILVVSISLIYIFNGDTQLGTFEQAHECSGTLDNCRMSWCDYNGESTYYRKSVPITTMQNWYSNNAELSCHLSVINSKRDGNLKPYLDIELEGTASTSPELDENIMTNTGTGWVYCQLPSAGSTRGIIRDECDVTISWTIEETPPVTTCEDYGYTTDTPTCGVNEQAKIKYVDTLTCYDGCESDGTVTPPVITPPILTCEDYGYTTDTPTCTTGIPIKVEQDDMQCYDGCTIETPTIQTTCEELGYTTSSPFCTYGAKTLTIDTLTCYNGCKSAPITTPSGNDYIPTPSAEQFDNNWLIIIGIAMVVIIALVFILKPKSKTRRERR